MSINLSDYRSLFVKVMLALFKQHPVSQYQTFEEAAPFLIRTIHSWPVGQFETFVMENVHDNKQVDSEIMAMVTGASRSGDTSVGQFRYFHHINQQ